MKYLISFIGLVLLTNINVNAQSEFAQNLPQEIKEKISKIKLSNDWEALLDLEGLEVTVKVACNVGKDQKGFLFYPNKMIPVENPHWEILFPIFREVMNKEEAQHIAWALENISFNKKIVKRL